jgi:hypothetical protein
VSSGVGAAESSGRSGDGRTAASPEPDPKVDWTGSPDQAREVAAARNVPYVLFFCTEETAKFAGEGPAVIADYRKSHPGAAPALTPFDDRAVVAVVRDWPQTEADRTARPLHYLELLERWSRGMLARVQECRPGSRDLVDS